MMAKRYCSINKKIIKLISRGQIINLITKTNKSVSLSEIYKQFKIVDKITQKALYNRLRAMVKDKQLIVNKGLYKINPNTKFYLGIVYEHPNGYGFVDFDDDTESLFLGPKYLSSLMTGDKVYVSKIIRGTKNYAILVKIVERSTKYIVGNFFKKGKKNFIYSNKFSSKTIELIDKNLVFKKGDKIKVEIKNYPEKDNYLKTKVVACFNDSLVSDEIIVNYSIPHEWNNKINKELKKIEEINLKNEIKKRVDLIDLPFITIDGEDSKDFDDSIYVENTKSNGYKLYVAIADVSFFVKQSSELDKEARKRGNSVYFPDQVVPMLPELLSNDLCSLIPKKQRLSLVCIISFDKKGIIRSYKFEEAVIKSYSRQTYKNINDYFNGDKQATDIDLSTKCIKSVSVAKKLTNILLTRRKNRGASEFNLKTFKLLTNKEDIKIKNEQRNIAHLLIEEFMIVANVCAAKYITKAKKMIYRIHDTPDFDSLVNLSDKVKNSEGINQNCVSLLKPKGFAQFLEKINKLENGYLLQREALKATQKAIYDIHSLGHFGLALDCYTHFTSPIRRYSDLVVHRLIKNLINAKQIYKYSINELKSIANACNLAEKRTSKAVYDTEKIYKCQYMLSHVGEIFDAFITNYFDNKILFELEKIPITGEIKNSLNCDGLKKISVKVLNVNVMTKSINFELI